VIRSSIRASKLTVVAVVTVFGLFFGAATANAQTCYPGTFTDVPPTHPFFADITWLANEGITTGYADCTFRPTLSITRQAMASFIWRYAGEPPVPVGAPTFPDVPESNPFSDAIRWLASEGITTGYADGTFRPAVPAGGPSFPDVPPDHKFYTPIMWLAATGITTGFADGEFKPLNNTSRQAMAAFLNRYNNTIGAPVATLSEDLSASMASDRSAVEQLTGSNGARLALVLPLLAGALLLGNRRRQSEI